MNMGLVRKIASKYMKYIDRDTLIQEGSLGLIKAVEKFDIDKGFQFSTYATFCIEGRIKIFIRDKREDIPFKIKRDDYNLFNLICKTQEKLCKELNRDVTLIEIAEYLDIEYDKVSNAMVAMKGNMSLYDHKVSNDKEDKETFIIDYIENKAAISEDAILDNVVLENALSQLDNKSREIIELRYVKDLTQSQVGQMLNISQVQVSRLEKKVLKNIKKYIETGTSSKKIKQNQHIENKLPNKIMPQGGISMSKNLADLNNVLFEQLEKLSNPNLKDKALKDEIERSQAIAKIASQIINNGSLVLKIKSMQDKDLIKIDNAIPMLETKETPSRNK